MKPPVSNTAAPRFDVDALRGRAGEEVFARGAAYHAAGRVELASIQAGRVAARVLGSQIYDADLKIVGTDFRGTCTCRAFEGRGFCKHLVAVALAANDPASREASHSRGPLDPIRDHLRNLEAGALVDLVLEQAGKDPALRRRLELAAALTQGDDGTIRAQLKKAITAATRTDGVDYRRVRNWSRAIGDLLDEIETLLDGGRAQLGLDLLEHVLDRMQQALNEIDDSDGAGIALLGRAENLHLRACEAARPNPVALAQALFKREMESASDAFLGAAGTYADVLGREGTAEYRRLAEAAWAQIPSRRADDRHASQDYDYASRRYTLFSILDRFAEREGDIDARVALRIQDLSTAQAYESLVELHSAHHRVEAALKWAEEGLRLFQDASADRLARQAAALYLQLGRKADAEAILWRCFEAKPHPATLRQLEVLAGPDGANAVLDRTIAVMERRLAGRQTMAGSWGYSDSDFLIELLLAGGRLAEAWAVVEKHGSVDRTLLALAAASEATDPLKVITVYERLVERCVRSTIQQNYEEACRLIDRIDRVRQDRGETAIHAAYLADLAARHKAKRNFIKLLAAR
ncbi:MAG TPA: SWIM zinc finger family protein [Inquilinus sp.]|nr:SWIM zinc finger family protein [Inquilinus sp.]